jgi:hypothetical protein
MRKPIAYTAALTMLLSIGASPAQAQIASFSKIQDAVPLAFFDAATSTADAVDPNRLIIGFDTGLDPITFLEREFRVSALPFSNRVATDTISFEIAAPIGYYISKITYTQQGAGFTGRTAVEDGTASWVVAGVPASLGVFTSEPTLSRTADVAALKAQTVPVSITVTLFAGASGGLEITGADVQVELSLIELLPAELLPPPR